MGIGSTLENHCHSTQSLLNQEMQLELYYTKRKTFITFCAESSLGAKSSEMDRKTVEISVLWSDESTFQLVFGKNRRRILRAKDEKDHPDCYQRKCAKN